MYQVQTLVHQALNLEDSTVELADPEHVGGDVILRLQTKGYGGTVYTSLTLEEARWLHDSLGAVLSPVPARESVSV